MHHMSIFYFEDVKKNNKTVTIAFTIGDGSNVIKSVSACLFVRRKLRSFISKFGVFRIRSHSREMGGNGK